MTKDSIKKLENKALSYIFENVKPGEPQSVIDNIKTSLNQVNKRITELNEDISSEEVIFAKAFTDIKTGVINVNQTIASVRAITKTTKVDLESLNIIKSILEKVLEKASEEKNNNSAEAIIEQIAEKVSIVNSKK